MIRYVVNGKTVERLNHGERGELVIAALRARPWQTEQELNVHHKVLKRLMTKGRITRREGLRKSNAYEYAIAGEGRGC